MGRIETDNTRQKMDMPITPCPKVLYWYNGKLLSM